MLSGHHADGRTSSGTFGLGTDPIGAAAPSNRSEQRVPSGFCAVVMNGSAGRVAAAYVVAMAVHAGVVSDRVAQITTVSVGTSKLTPAGAPLRLCARVSASGCAIARRSDGVRTTASSQPTVASSEAPGALEPRSKRPPSS